MERGYLDYITKDMSKTNVRRACYIVREYLKYSNDNKDKCAVSSQEYLEAVNILLAYSYENSDSMTEVELFVCESDCSHNNGFGGFCNGEFSLSKNSNDKTLKLCKHYSDSQFI